MEITLQTKIYDLLKAYPFLEDELIRINPKFKKLKNPVLRRTVARIASIKQAAIVGGMDPIDLLNKIREAVGLEPVEVESQETQEEPVPEWVTEEPVAVLDANELLDQGKNPLAEVMKKLKEAKKGDVILLKADFRPEPLIDELRKKGYEVYSAQSGEEHFTYIRR
ncbi:MAG: hypothetical protein C6H99_05925 [Epsilonproteobacteria bacterium]|nr:hypothetical protein [Campylobacterota bacterium]NPA64017.1 DUF1858 domain-containing protein [Campylobacterota bacterium]